MLAGRILQCEIVWQFQKALEEKCYITSESKRTTCILPIIKESYFSEEILGGTPFLKRGKILY